LRVVSLHKRAQQEIEKNETHIRRFT